LDFSAFNVYMGPQTQVMHQGSISNTTAGIAKAYWAALEAHEKGAAFYLSLLGSQNAKVIMIEDP
jgi:hypothetical protein